MRAAGLKPEDLAEFRVEPAWADLAGWGFVDTAVAVVVEVVAGAFRGFEVWRSDAVAVLGDAGRADFTGTVEVRARTSLVDDVIRIVVPSVAAFCEWGIVGCRGRACIGGRGRCGRSKRALAPTAYGGRQQ